MTEETQAIEPNFASEQAGEYWALVKAEKGDDVNIDDIEGTGKDGAIKKSDIDEYLETLEGDDDPELDDNEDDDDDVDMINSEVVVNLTDNRFAIEDMILEPRAKAQATDSVLASKRLKHAIEIGVLGIE